nr:GAF domain-containing sensor histidine kinase [Salsipaludibacter albus]
MAATLEDGLGLTWARVHLDGPAAPASSHDAPPPTPPVLAVPIELEGEHLGTVECGPRRDGDLTDDDRLVVETLARQAALAVRNVRLTAELARQADRLAASRTRLVRAQEVERRRIERNIHDGVQQELVALISQAGQVGRDLDHDPAAAATDLADLQVGLRRVLKDLRELAAGIHPSLLSDRGLLAAVESLAARNPVPVTLRADPRLRSLRASEEVEGAGYFTVAEALANSLKHAEASCVDVTLSRAGDSLHITVHDDGRGFGVGAGPDRDGRFGGNGLSNLAERVTALGGEFQVVGGPDRGTTVTAVLPVGRS